MIKEVSVASPASQKRKVIVFASSSPAYNSSRFIVRKSAIGVSPVKVSPFKLLIKDGDGKLYTVENHIINEELSETTDVLVGLEETEVNRCVFHFKGLTVRIILESNIR